MVRPDYRIVTVIFGNSNPGFDRLIDVFLHSCACNAGRAEVHVIGTGRPCPRNDSENPSYADNSEKLRIWEEELKKSDVPVAFLDADMLVLRPLMDAFGPCHVNLTLRPGAMWLNAGAVFCLPTPKAQDIMRVWRETNDSIRDNKEWLDRAIEHHNGLNQTAMVHLLEEEYYQHFEDGDIGYLSCDKYNCMDTTWRMFDLDRCSILHIKGRLREAVLGRARAVESCVQPYLVWKRYEIAARKHVRVP